MARQVRYIVTSDLSGKELDDDAAAVVETFDWNGAAYEFDRAPDEGDLALDTSMRELIEIARERSEDDNELPQGTVTVLPSTTRKATTKKAASKSTSTASDGRGPIPGAPMFSKAVYEEEFPGTEHNGVMWLLCPRCPEEKKDVMSLRAHIKGVHGEPMWKIVADRRGITYPAGL